MTGRRRVLVAVAVAAVVAAVALAGVGVVRQHRSGSGDRPSAADARATRLASVLDHPPGVSAVDVGAGRDLRGNPYVATVVSLAPSATGAQVADLIVAMPAAARRAGLPGTAGYRQLTFLTRSGARLSVGWDTAVDPAALAAAATGWLAVDRSLDGPDRPDLSAVVLASGAVSYRIGLGRTGSDGLLAAYAKASEAVAPTGGDVVGWALTGSSGPTGLALSADGPLDAARRREWTDLLAAAGRLRTPLSASRVEVSFGDRVEAHLSLLAPDRVDAAGLTPAAYGGAVWPAVRAQLRTVTAHTDHWSYFLSWAHRSTPGSERLLALLFGDQGTVTDDTGEDHSPDASAGWAEAARAYLRGR